MSFGCDMLSRLSRYAVESYLEQILSHGFFHADPVSCLIPLFILVLAMVCKH